ncbi:MAG: hypothetical protein ACPGRD_01900 [Planktomarina sp.]
MVVVAIAMVLIGYAFVVDNVILVYGFSGFAVFGFFKIFQNRLTNATTTKVMTILANDLGYDGFQQVPDLWETLKATPYFRGLRVRQIINQITGQLAGIRYRTCFSHVTDSDDENPKTVFRGVVIVATVESIQNFDIIPKRSRQRGILLELFGKRQDEALMSIHHNGEFFEIFSKSDLGYDAFKAYFKTLDDAVRDPLMLTFVQRSRTQCVAGFEADQRLFKIGGIFKGKAAVRQDIEQALSNLKIPVKMAAGIIAAEAELG